MTFFAITTLMMINHRCKRAAAADSWNQAKLSPEEKKSDSKLTKAINDL